ncbi:Non-specific serine/threonine protein kinase [Handroanthus impetiginosus]|uniref:Non-specific serine/threonine protein kinase n=1 Tax=Handroanthus impetiginosus TaxID=429701 RepID=A0A2G9I917_9LAMI|nr:Non-specific serine/threonine protein kinase [Handroanthus impetiginosus]
MCGKVAIPHPFGIGPQCKANCSFIVICLNTTIPHKPILRSINMEALFISLHGTIRVKQPIAPMNCSNVQKTQFMAISFVRSPFTILDYYNSLVILGCQNVVWLLSNKTTTIGGCMAICGAKSTDTTYNGEIQYTYQSIQSNTSFCRYRFPTDKKWLKENYKMFKYLQSDLLNPFDQEFFSAPLYSYLYPNFLLLFLSSKTNYESQNKYCRCYVGFEKNPYIPGGCINIDECGNTTLNNCENRTCINIIGSYTYCSEELAHATDHYNENCVLGRGGPVYKGMLIDGRIMTVKKSKRVDESDLELFINDIIH